MNESVAGRGSKRLVLLERRNHPDGISSFGSLLGLLVIVDSELWDSWSSAEREAAVHWAYAAHARSIPLARLFGWSNIYGVDRDSLFLGAQPSALIAFLESLKRARLKPGQESETAFSGLSALGPSWILPWPGLQERIQKLSQVGGKLI